MAPSAPVPPEFPPGTWAAGEPVQLDVTPLGRINQQATAQVTLTVPATCAGGSASDPPLTMAGLRVRLLLATTPPEVQDQAWRHTAAMARTHKGDWNLFALGLAYPGLRARAWRLTEAMDQATTAQVQFRLAGDFLLALHRLDLDRPHLARLLIATAYDHTSRRKQRPEPATASLDTATSLPAAGWPQPSPRSVLDQLITRTASAPPGQAFTRLHAELVARTYLDGERLKDVAASLGMTASTASKHRTHAVAIIARHLGHPRAGLTDPAPQRQPHQAPPVAHPEAASPGPQPAPPTPP